MHFMIHNKFLKKLAATIMTVTVAISLSACSDKISSQTVDPVDVLLVTDIGTVEDGSFNQGAWEGIKKFGEESGKICKYYQPAEANIDAYLDEIKTGIGNGAEVVVCPGYLLEEAVYEASSKYPDVSFILLDGNPHNADYSDTTIEKNVMPIAFAEEQAGFLAGYAAVRDGYTGLGFMGGVAEDPVIRYGYGFVQGADYAAIEMGVNVHIRYTYTNTFSEDVNVETMARTWYGDDTQVIFACGGAMGRSVMCAAEEVGGKVIGVDVDQSSESPAVITSAMKSLSEAVYTAVKDYYDGKFVGGVDKVFSASEDGVCLPMDSSKFEKFTSVEYNSVLNLLVDRIIAPYSQTDIGTTQELTLINTEVTYIDYLSGE